MTLDPNRAQKNQRQKVNPTIKIILILEEIFNGKKEKEQYPEAHRL